MIANEKGLSNSTLQQEAEIYPNLGSGNNACSFLIRYDPSGILVFLSTGTNTY